MTNERDETVMALARWFERENINDFDDLNRELTRLIEEDEAWLQANEDGLVDAARAAMKVLDRLIAPCPQCHTLGPQKDCPTLIHTLPQEAKDDIRSASALLYSALGPFTVEAPNGKQTP
jgi:hypothetical protein